MTRRRRAVKMGTIKRRDWTRPIIDVEGTFRGLHRAVTGKSGLFSHGRSKSNRRSG